MNKSNSLDKAQIYSIFPTALVKGQVPDITLCDRLELAIREEMNQKNGIFEPGVFSSYDMLHTKDNFKELADLVMVESGLFMDWLKLKRDSHYITGMWANVTNPAHRHPVHIHPNCYISGVLYVKTPDKCGTISFVDPRPGARVFEPNYEQITDWTCGVVPFTPEKGTMFMWPSWLPHNVDRGFCNDENEERMVIAFNVQMIGKIETRTCKLNVV